MKKNTAQISGAISQKGVQEPELVAPNATLRNVGFDRQLCLYARCAPPSPPDPLLAPLSQESHQSLRLQATGSANGKHQEEIREQEGRKRDGRMNLFSAFSLPGCGYGRASAP